MPKTFHYGSIQVTVPDDYDIPERAGQLDDAEVDRIHNPYGGLEPALASAATLMESFQNPASEQPNTATDPATTPTPTPTSALSLPPHITVATLRAASKRLITSDLIQKHLSLAIKTLVQANLLDLDAGYRLLSELNDQVKAQGKNNETIKTAFEPVRTYFKGKKDKKDKKDKKSKDEKHKEEK
jgi:hypothetical protein